MKRLLLMVTAALIAVTAMALDAPNGYVLRDYKFPSDNECEDIAIYASSSNNSDIYTSYQSSDIKLYGRDLYGRDSRPQSIVVALNALEDCVMYYDLCVLQEFWGSKTLKIYCDDQYVETFQTIRSTGNELSGFALELTKGTHYVKFVTNESNWRIRNIKVIEQPSIEVTLLEPGSLGTEILYNDVERLQDVRKLKVSGPMNDDDLEKITMMRGNLTYLDLSDAVLTSIPDRMFYSEAKFLHTVLLPEGLRSIGEYAFYGTPLNHVNFPSTLESIGKWAFGDTPLREAIMPDATQQIGSCAFNDCYYLKNVRLSKNLKVIPDNCFYQCENLILTEDPQNLIEVGISAFRGCLHVNFDLPSTLRTIKYYAFFETNREPIETIPLKEVLNIPEGCTVQYEAFNGTHYTTAVMPNSFHTVDYECPVWFLGKDSLTIKLKSSTVVDPVNKIVGNDAFGMNTILVPKHLVNAYKLHPYWYKFKEIKGFDTEELDFWGIYSPLVLGANERLNGTPSIFIYQNGSLKIGGAAPMPINDLTIDSNKTNYNWGKVIVNSDNVPITGNLEVHFCLPKNYWSFLSLPFDLRVGDINTHCAGQFAIRYYDGANRAEHGATGSWKNFNDDDIIPAGTGFIVNTSLTDWWFFPSQDNESKQYITSNKMFVKELQHYDAELAANRSWNLIGNPYQCYYNMHKLNFTAPFTVRSGNNYVAYSIIDDDYALMPNEAFFVQCPDEVSTISFPVDGRQMTSEITSQQGKPAYEAASQGRCIIDIALSEGSEATDRTRLVVNDDAQMGYEIGVDASKFAPEAPMAQIYTLGTDGERLAINERPAADGTAALGFTAAADGVYTISSPRCQVNSLYLIDNAKGTAIDLSSADYTFTAEAGTDDTRFVLHFDNDTTGIDNFYVSIPSVKVEADGIIVDCDAEIYNIAGIKVAAVAAGAKVSLPCGIYVVKSGVSAVKVTVL